MALILVTPPAQEPVTLVEAKAHLRVAGGDDDGLITRMISAARRACERETNRALITQTWRYTRRCFPEGDCPLRLPKPPLQSVSSIKYIDLNGVLQTMDAGDYVEELVDDEDGVLGHVRPVYGGSWPSTRDEPSAVRVEYVAGYGSASSSLPADLLLGLMATVGDFYEYRESFITGTIGTQVPVAAKGYFESYAVLWRET